MHYAALDAYILVELYHALQKEANEKGIATANHIRPLDSRNYEPHLKADDSDDEENNFLE